MRFQLKMDRRAGVRRRFVRWLAPVVGAAIPVLLFAHSTGPDPGHSGVPGESTCAQCHSGGAGTGSVSVSGFNSAMNYTPGVAQTLTVTVADPVQRRWGFQLTARPASNAQQQAGTFTPGSDGFTQLSCGVLPFNSGFFAQENIGDSCAGSLSQLPLEYVEHTAAGTRLGQTGSAAFTFTWTPPATAVGDIVIYVAGNAANGDGTPSGDHIYLAKYTVSAVASSAPSITSVVNSAGGQNTIAAGSWMTIYGSGLSATTRAWQASDFTNNGQGEPQQLDGVSVTVGGQPAYISYISPLQINAQVPNAPVGQTTVTVTNSNGTSQSANATVALVSPAAFVWNGKYAVATRPDFSLVGPPGLFSSVTTTPARPGDTIIIWATGFGATTPSLDPGTLTPASSVTVKDSITTTIGGLLANFVGAAMTPGTAGLYQIAVQVPSGAQTGDQPLVMTIDGVQSPSGVFINVQQ